MKILFVLKKRSFYGPSYGLKCSCDMISKMLKLYHNINSEIVEVIDGNFIDKEVFNNKPTHVFLEAIWCPPYKVKELVNKYKNIKWFVRLHSDSPFIAGEGIAFQWIKEYWNIVCESNNFNISCNSKRIIDELELSLGIACLYSPNIYFDYKHKRKLRHKNDRCLDIACFGAIRLLKSHLSQAIAAIAYGNINCIRVRFHINRNRLEGGQADSILKNLRNLFNGTNHELIEHDWMSHDELIEFIQEHIDIGMAVSFSETFCITAYDYVANKIPVVGSKEIKNILSIYKCDPTDIESMLFSIKMADNSRILKLHLLNNVLLNRDTNKALLEWKNLIR